MSTELFRELMAMHVTVQMGTYFIDDVDLGDGLRFASSARVTDCYWNYAYQLNAEPSVLPDQIARVREYAASIDRAPAVYLEANGAAENLAAALGAAIVSSETWMVLEGVLPEEAPPEGVQIAKLSHSDRLDQFIDVFTDAYGEGDEDSPGYSGLPDEYPTSLREASPRDGVEIDHWVATADGRPAAIASAYRSGAYAGIYNVGTAHWARRRHLGSYVSIQSVRSALAKGSSRVFLQTEADSDVEQMYAKLGFVRVFVGHLLELPMT